MAKRLTKEERVRAQICFECDLIPSQAVWKQICQEQGEEYKSVRYMADQLEISDDEMVTVECLQSKEEVHVVADNYNWDNESLDSLYAILNHPLCDAGTALLLFWKGAGYSALAPNPRLTTAEEVEFYKELCNRFKNKQFNSYKIAFDPYDETFVPSLDEYLENNYYMPPEFFCTYSTMYVKDDL